jgi:hypothetical protein
MLGQPRPLQQLKGFLLDGAQQKRVGGGAAWTVLFWISMDIQLRRALHPNTPRPRLSRLCLQSRLSRLQVASRRQTITRRARVAGLLAIFGQFRMHHGPKGHG